MTNSTQKTTVFYATALALMLAFVAVLVPANASAATYAYVASTGEVKSVVADTWMAAIATAPGIHIHSGVMLLKSAADFTIIGDDVSSI